MIRLHIGHHFYAAGNIGDDLMIAGFLAALREHGIAESVELTCCTPFDLASQHLRFPEIEWLPYTPADRGRCIAECDAWLGLGGSPFQGDQSSWFLDHLIEDRAACLRHGKPMYFLGVGVNAARDLGHAQTRAVLDAAAHVWTRDALSAELFAGACGAGRVTAGADLSHVYFAGTEASSTPLPSPEPDVTGFTLNFEDPAQFRADALRALLEGLAARGGAARWMVQEVRTLPGSEIETYDALPPEHRQRLDVRVPAYATARSVAELLAAWGMPAQLLTSRYHAAIVGCWAGARVVAVERAAKIRGIVEPAGCRSLSSLTSAEDAARALADAAPVPAERMRRLAELASRCCGEFFRQVGAGASPVVVANGSVRGDATDAIGAAAAAETGPADLTSPAEDPCSQSA